MAVIVFVVLIVFDAGGPPTPNPKAKLKRTELLRPEVYIHGCAACFALSNTLSHLKCRRINIS